MPKENKVKIMKHIAELFDKFSPYFKMYTTYCSNHPQSLIKIEKLKSNPAFVNTLQKSETDQRVKGSLLSYLIKPIQRICKYPLLFRELISETQEQITIDSLEKTKSKIEEVVIYVNEGKRVAENLQKVVNIQNSFQNAFGKTKVDLIDVHRRFIREGQLLVKGKSFTDLNPKLKAFDIILFNDVILIAKKKNDSYDLKAKLNLESVRLVLSADSESIQNAFELHDKKVYVLSAATAFERDSWFKDIKACKKFLQQRNFGNNKGGSVINTSPNNRQTQEFQNTQEYQNQPEYQFDPNQQYDPNYQQEFQGQEEFQYDQNQDYKTHGEYDIQNNQSQQQQQEFEYDENQQYQFNELQNERQN